MAEYRVAVQATTTLHVLKFTLQMLTALTSSVTSAKTFQAVAATAPNESQTPVWPAGFPALALLFFTLPRRLRKRWSRRVLLVLLMLGSLSAVVVMIGCGGHSKPALISTDYAVTIAGFNEADVHTTTLTLTVK